MALRRDAGRPRPRPPADGRDSAETLHSYFMVRSAQSSNSSVAALNCYVSGRIQERTTVTPSVRDPPVLMRMSSRFRGVSAARLAVDATCDDPKQQSAPRITEGTWW